LRNVTVTNNSVGVSAIGAGATSTTGIRLSVSDSLLAANAGRGLSAQSATGASTVDVMLNSVSLTGNAGGAIQTDSGQAVITVGFSTITQNTGAAAVNAINGGLIFSNGNNQFQNNPGGPGAFTGPANLQ
jgi:hypothetical protein